MTGTLTIRYRRPTPLLAPLELAARHTGSESRKVFAWGGLYHEGELTAEAEGIFIHVEPERMLDIVTGNAHGAHSAEGPLVDADWQRMMEKAARQRDALHLAAADCPRSVTPLSRSTLCRAGPDAYSVASSRRRSSSPVRHPMAGRGRPGGPAGRRGTLGLPRRRAPTSSAADHGAGVRSP